MLLLDCLAINWHPECLNRRLQTAHGCWPVKWSKCLPLKGNTSLSSTRCSDSGIVYCVHVVHKSTLPGKIATGISRQLVMQSELLSPSSSAERRVAIPVAIPSKLFRPAFHGVLHYCSEQSLMDNVYIMWRWLCTHEVSQGCWSALTASRRFSRKQTMKFCAAEECLGGIAAASILPI